jgi:Holliday junction resolvasome RuvABC ATP-dependent DNA helicase subunit
MTGSDEISRAVAALVAAAGVAGHDASEVTAEARTLAAAASSRASGASDAWATAFDERGAAFEAAAAVGAAFRNGPTPVLARLVTEDAAAARTYATALSDLASAACSLGEPSLSAVGDASVIAASQLRAAGVALAPSVPATPTNAVAAGATSGASVATAEPTPGAAKPAPTGSPPKTLEELLDDLDALIGLESVKAEVRRQAQVLRVAALRSAKQLREPDLTRHLVFVGNPGTGKTTVARLVVGIYRALGVLEQGQLVECDRSSLVAGYVGQTAIKTSDMITKALGGALFIDEAYGLVDGEFGHEAIDTLVKAMEDHRDDFVVIAAGYPEPMDEFIHANPGLESRFRLTLEFEDYSDDELVAIFERLADAGDFTPTEPCTARLRELLATVPRGDGFGNGRFVRNLFEAAVVRQAWRLRDTPDPSVQQLQELLPEDLTEPDLVSTHR